MMINIDEVMEQDEFEKREALIKRQKALRKKRKRRFRLSLFLFVLLIVAVYVFSPVSNLNIIHVNGNKIYNEEEVIEIAEVVEGNKTITYIPHFVEQKLEADSLIKEAYVSTDFFNRLNIEIVEEKGVAYYSKEGQHYILLENGEEILVSEMKDVIELPYLVDLDEAQRKLFVEGAKEVAPSDLALVSEVSHYSTSYDKNMVEMLMQDGLKVRSTMDGIALLEYYTDTVKGITSSDKCIMFIEETNTIATQSCD